MSSRIKDLLDRGRDDGSDGTPRAPLRDFRYFEPPLFASALLWLFLLVKYMQWNYRLEFLGAIRFEFIVGAALVIVTVGVHVSSRLSFRHSRGIIVGMALLLVTMLFSVPFAIDPEMAWSGFMDHGVKFSMLTLGIAVMVRSPRTMRWFIAAFIFSMLYLCQESFRAGLSGSMIWENQGIPRLHGSIPMLNHPNSLGSYILGVVPFSVFLLGTIRSKWQRLVLLGILPMAGCIILWTGSRTAYVGTLLFFPIWFAFSKRKTTWVLVAVIGTILLFPVTPDSYKERFLSIGGQEKEGHSRLKRMALNKLAWDAFLARPTGYGIEAFQFVSQAANGRAMEVHCLYLQILSHIGLQGLIAFGIMVASTLKAYFDAHRSFNKQLMRLRRYRATIGRRRRFPAAAVRHMQDLKFLDAVTKALIAFIITRLVVGVFSQDLYEIYWYFCAGLAISLNSLRGSTLRMSRRILDAPGDAEAP